MAIKLEIDDQRKEILTANGHLLVEGGPGSGKTTIALLKAMKLIDDGLVGLNQKILFLSFARATVARVEEQASHLFNSEHKRKIEVNTYHGFCWSVIQSFGTHLIPHKLFKLITPPALSSLTSTLSKDERTVFVEKMFVEKGVVGFDLFSKIASEIFEKGAKICSIYNKAYPIIIVDEFQDTDDNEWRLIKLLGINSSIIALADLQQRIFEFRGASVTRIPEFKEHFKAKMFNLGKDNNRSANTDIATFGDDLLTGTNKGKVYTDVTIIPYTPFKNDPKQQLKYAVFTSLKRLKRLMPGGGWSIAILVKTKAETLQVSTYFTSININHDVIIDPAGPSLAASFIAKLMEPINDGIISIDKIIKELLNHIKGRKEKLTGADGKICQVLEQFLETQKVRGKNNQQLINDILKLIEGRQEIIFSGVPEEDWLKVRSIFQSLTSQSLKDVYEDAKFLRLLNKGAILREKLAKVWRDNQCYHNAAQSVDEALTQEHFAMSSRKYNGIYVMNIHKSKGKEFDEVIIWEDAFKSLVKQNINPTSNDRILLRVAITRSRSHSTILTPQRNPCILL